MSAQTRSRPDRTERLPADMELQRAPCRTGGAGNAARQEDLRRRGVFEAVESNGGGDANFLYAHSGGGHVGAGYGLYSHRFAGGGEVDLFTQNMGAGLDGEGMYIGGDAQFFRATTGDEGLINADASALRAYGEFSSTEEGLSVGTGVSLIEGAVTTGCTDPSYQHDLQTRFGLSLGLGMGGRLHYADQDGDDIPEIGMGFDIGPVSLDMRSETLGHASNALADAMHEGPGGMRAMPGEARAQARRDPEVAAELDRRTRANDDRTSSRRRAHRLLQADPRYAGDRAAIDRRLDRVEGRFGGDWPKILRYLGGE